MKSLLRTGLPALLLAALFAAMPLCALPHGGVQTAIVQAAEQTLRRGSRGEAVKTVQQKLIRWGYLNGKADGIFGPATEKAVRYFQRKNGLKEDGIVGPATFEALGMRASGGTTAGGADSYTNEDTYLLARCIYGEARGEPYTGQVAVGAVVLNRVKSPEFPNTIAGVIYQRHAFTAVSDGQINLTPDQTALNAAKDAMNGWDPTGGCLYYYNPAKATSSWIFSRETVVTIGKHVFAI